MECRETQKGIANFIAQDACLGEEYMLQVQRLANKLLAMQATCVMNRKQKGNKKKNRRIFKVKLSTVQVLYAQCWQKKIWLLFSVHIHFFGFVKDNGMHA